MQPGAEPGVRSGGAERRPCGAGAMGDSAARVEGERGSQGGLAARLRGGLGYSRSPCPARSPWAMASGPTFCAGGGIGPGSLGPG